MLGSAFRRLGVSTQVEGSVANAFGSLDLVQAEGASRFEPYDLILCDVNLIDGALGDLLDGVARRGGVAPGACPRRCRRWWR